MKNPSSDLISRQIRLKLVEMSHRANTPHLGSALSCVDILVAAYWHVLAIDPQKPFGALRDRFILSKGHAASALYAALAFRGFFPLATLDSFAENGSSLTEHPNACCVPGVEVSTGSLGHGLSLGIGMAVASRILSQPYRIFVLLSDGECNEGSVWEAALWAPNRQLNNVCVVVDYNKWQATGRSEDIMALKSLRDKWQSFGWEAIEVDGHDIEALTLHMQKIPHPSRKPVALIAHTIKGKGVSFMEDDNNWHYRIPTEEDVQKARVELKLQ